MNRRGLFAWIFGALGLAKAQNKVIKYSNPDVVPPYKNGRCPACGTMAPKIIAKELTDRAAAKVCADRPPTIEQARCLQAATKGAQEALEGGKLTRCARCSNAFYQDAE